MNTVQDTIDQARLAVSLLNLTRCVGKRPVVKNLACQHCGSPNPSQHCNAPRQNVTSSEKTKSEPTSTETQP